MPWLRLAPVRNGCGFFPGKHRNDGAGVEDLPDIMIEIMICAVRDRVLFFGKYSPRLARIRRAVSVGVSFLTRASTASRRAATTASVMLVWSSLASLRASASASGLRILRVIDVAICMSQWMLLYATSQVVLQPASR